VARVRALTCFAASFASSILFFGYPSSMLPLVSTTITTSFGPLLAATYHGRRRGSYPPQFCNTSSVNKGATRVNKGGGGEVRARYSVDNVGRVSGRSSLK